MSKPNPLAALAPEIPEMSELPVRMTLGATPLFGALLILAGGFFPLVIFLILTLIGWIADVPPAWFWIKTVFVVVPLLALPWGWWVLKSREAIEIGAETVHWEKRTPLGTRSWQAPLAEFRGYRLRAVMPSSTSSDRVARYQVEMGHPDPDKRPKLTHTKDRNLAAQVQARLVSLTGLPALEED